MTWTCAAIDHGVTIFSNGKIGPCCQIDAKYLKPISELVNPDRFVDLKTQNCPPEHPCNKCSVAEYNKLPSYRNMFNSIVRPDSGLQFVDIRNTNLCNLKCRYCGPHFSSKWAEELNEFAVIQHQDIINYKNILITDSLHWMYFTGGEPLINGEHWALLNELIDSGKSARISLLYNTNLTTIKYKDTNIIDVWKKFKNVTIQCSIDAIGKPLEYIRSGTRWEKIKLNLEQLIMSAKNSNIKITFTPLLTILNLWFIDELYKYSSLNNIPINMNILTGPDYLALDVIPDSLKSLALDKITKLESEYKINNNVILHIKNLINNNINQTLFRHTIAHILLLDNLRGEKLFELLPFKSFAVDNILKNYEYE
ncbi:Radical_SAM domain containing protein [uncultured Caudovirales phage]|uniref:Radical_SAM domain containing protein n=1 Tax=uncultured Caudovirales phage TaxID=2100421 RepID=A0A6J5P8J4_9CAUD|nr:Radical_SAM domain containing protein [uncultured Caudovirales phage]CAB4165731.1 Radical_SAM domain containing protein [uncultured Caudovirales phage]CAB4187039.1 Radical_SAM domain containing protein [uncultured Caudovirales phage]CAB4221156.1 Radical_SAM domain containing protein [uncultured Caudovirales phage]